MNQSEDIPQTPTPALTPSFLIKKEFEPIRDFRKRSTTGGEMQDAQRSSSLRCESGSAPFHLDFQQSESFIRAQRNLGMMERSMNSSSLSQRNFPSFTARSSSSFILDESRDGDKVLKRTNSSFKIDAKLLENLEVLEAQEVEQAVSARKFQILKSIEEITFQNQVYRQKLQNEKIKQIVSRLRSWKTRTAKVVFDRLRTETEKIGKFSSSFRLMKTHLAKTQLSVIKKLAEFAKIKRTFESLERNFSKFSSRAKQDCLDNLQIFTTERKRLKITERGANAIRRFLSYKNSPFVLQAFLMIRDRPKENVQKKSRPVAQILITAIDRILFRAQHKMVILAFFDISKKARSEPPKKFVLTPSKKTISGKKTSPREVQQRMMETDNFGGPKISAYKKFFEQINDDTNLQIQKNETKVRESLYKKQPSKQLKAAKSLNKIDSVSHAMPENDDTDVEENVGDSRNRVWVGISDIYNL